MWFANLSDATPQWSFLEDPIGTGKTSGQIGRTLRLGDPINTGPNSTWHQLTWEGGALQDVWKDPQMFQKGDVDCITNTGKVRMWPGFISWYKNEHHGGGTVTAAGIQATKRSLAMCQGSRSDLDWRMTVLTIGQRDHVPWEPRAAFYELLQLHPGYGRGDSRNIQPIHWGPEPYRFITSIQADDYATGISLVGTATHMYFLDERNNSITEDTNAPKTTAAGFEFQWDSCVTYNDSIYYTHGNRLYKRRPKPPFGVLGTHTVIKTVNSALYLRGMTVWNNRLYFGAFHPGGSASVYVSDGSTTTKAFDFPSEFYPMKMVSCSGSLYVLGMQTSGFGQGGPNPNVVQQLWRYDGRSLKKMWQEGQFDDGRMHWGSDLTVWNGLVVWGCQGTSTSDQNTGNPRARHASLMFYDPVADAIVCGPGIPTDTNNTDGLWITGLQTWNNTIAVHFKDDTVYSNILRGPTMVATLRGQGQPRQDFRWPMAGDIAQYQDPTTLKKNAFLYSSEYHGDDDVASEKKTWLAVKMRVKLTGSHAHITVSARSGLDDTTFDVLRTIDDDGTGHWQDVIIPIKVGANYITSKKLQLKFELYNDAFNLPDDTDMPWIDDCAVQYMLSPIKTRQWQVRIPVTDNQLRLDLQGNPMTTASALAQQLEDLAFAAVPIKFWEPRTTAGAPPNGSFIEVRILNFQRQQSRLESVDTSLTGSVSLTLVENVTS